MSSRTTNVTVMPTPVDWQSRQGYRAYGPDSRDFWNRVNRPPSGVPQNVSGRLPAEERARTQSSGLASVSVPPHSAMHVLVLDDLNPTPGQRNMQDEQKKASKKLRKGIYIPTIKRWRKLSLYYRDSARNSLNEKSQKEEEVGDYSSCAICLDDFEPKQEVMVTPCSHVFHEECIVPWVRSRGQCPICRSVITE